MTEKFEPATDEEIQELFDNAPTLDEMLAEEANALPITIDEDFILWDQVPGPDPDA